MKVKDYLHQAYRLDHRINSDIEEMARLREMASSVSAPVFGEKVQTSRSTEAPFVRCIEKIMCSARWILCEEMNNTLGLLGKHPTTGKPIPSPFINIGISYMNQAIRQWNEIFQIVKENCTTEYSGANPQDDLMSGYVRGG